MELLMMDDGPIAILFVIGFFFLVFVLAKLSRFKPKYRQRIEEEMKKRKEIKKLKQQLQDLEK